VAVPRGDAFGTPTPATTATPLPPSPPADAPEGPAPPSACLRAPGSTRGVAALWRVALALAQDVADERPRQQDLPDGHRARPGVRAARPGVMGISRASISTGVMVSTDTMRRAGRVVTIDGGNCSAASGGASGGASAAEGGGSGGGGGEPCGGGGGPP